MSSVLFSLWQLLLPGQSTLPLVLEEKDRLTKARHAGAGNTRNVPAHRSGPRGSGLLSPHTGRLLCARATSRALQHSGLPPPASAGTYPHGSRVFDGLGSREPVWSSLTFVLVGDGTVVTEGWFSSCSFYWF